VLQRTTSVIYVRETPWFETGPPPPCFLRPLKVPWAVFSSDHARRD